MSEVQVDLPQPLVDVLGAPRGSYVYRVLKGGRGSGKSVGAATIAALWGYVEPIRILCVRQFQNSIQESFYREVVDALELHPWLKEHYTITKESITGANGTQFIFKGLDRNPQSIKSLAKIDLTIVEEAEDIPEQSWVNLEATVLRQPNSEIFVIYNPKKEGSPVDFRFIKNKAPRSIVAELNYSDNPFFPAGLETLRKRDLEIFDYPLYQHIWLGAYLKNSKSQIFNGRYEAKEFEPDPSWSMVQGLDWGYSQDPTAAIRAYVHDECLWISHEAGRAGIELDDVARECAVIPDFHKYAIRADSAQPAMISHVKNKGLPWIEPAVKGKGSVESGIQFIRSFRRVYIHPRCKNVLNEFATYSWKVDRLTGDVLDVPIDANNHYCIAEGQRVLTKRGRVPIEGVTTQDMVMTRSGWRAVLVSSMTGQNKEVIKVSTTLGDIVCTPDHPIHSGTCFIRADALSYGDEVTGDEEWLNSEAGMAGNIDVGLMPSKGQTGSIFKGRLQGALNIFIERFGNSITVQYLKGSIYTTLTKMLAITTSLILSAYPRQNMLQGTHSTMTGLLGKLFTLIKSGTLQRNGTPAQKVLRSTGGLEHSHTGTSSLPINHAPIVEKFSRPRGSEIKTSIAVMPASHQQGVNQASMTLSSNAYSAAKITSKTNTQKRKPVVGHVLTVCAMPEKKNVYNLLVDGENEFLCEGIMTHNCDALRYALEPIMKQGGFSLDWL